MADVKETAALPRRGIRFPLALKLTLVTSALLIFSLGIIIFSVWFFVRSDLRRTAAADNDGINYRVASAADSALDQITVNTALLLGNTRRSQKLIDFYFNQNPDIAALVSIKPGKSAETFINASFARSAEIDNSLISAFLSMRGNQLLRGSGEREFFNVSADFYGLPILVASFPYQEGIDALSLSMALVFFSAENLTDYFGSGASRSVMINNWGEVLIHPDADFVQSNLSSSPEVAMLSAGESHAVTHYRGSTGGVFASARRLQSGGAMVLTTIDDAVVFEGINATTIRNMYFALSVWFLSLILIRFFSSRLTRQIGTLEEAAQAIEEGFYRRSIPVSSRDETGILAESMNSMRLALLGFQRFTNKEIARLTQRGLLTPGGAGKDATFLFSDIRSFMAISEKMESAEVVEFLNDYMDRMVSCVMVSGGVIDKFIGDAVMAHWGAVKTGEEVKSREENARAAIRAALLMRASLQCLNRDRAGNNHPVIKIGCGINSGAAVAGQIGTDEKLEYTVIGREVSLAEYTESCNKPFGTEILITGKTRELCGACFITEEMPAIHESGDEIPLFAVVNVSGSDETKLLLAELESIPKIDMAIAARFVGPGGPKTLEELRRQLDISAPDLSKVTLDEREKKFKVQEP